MGVNILDEAQFEKLGEIYRGVTGKEKPTSTIKLFERTPKKLAEFYNLLIFSPLQFKLDDTDLEFLVEKGFLTYLSKLENRVTFTLKTLLVLEYNLNILDWKYK